jgi:hypothetical protein
MSEIQSRARATSDLHAKAIALWRMENISAAFLRNAQPGFTLNDSRLQREILAISHCGIGISAVEISAFKPADVSRLIDSFSNPAYRLFAYENIGAMLGLYEPDAFSFMAVGLARAGLIPMVSLRPPKPAKYLTAFPADIRRLISHGYGRMMFFKETTLSGAIRRIRAHPAIDFGAGLMGMAFGSSMVNSRDIHGLWFAAERIRDAFVRRNFINGLVFALEFWEWMAPASLPALAPRNAFAARMIERAQEGVNEGLARGGLPAFAVLDAG